MTLGINDNLKLLMPFNNQDTPHKGVVPNQETGKKMLNYLQKRYRSGVLLLLYLVNHLWPELFNTLCEISKCMYKANISPYKALIHAINYVVNTKYYFCLMIPEANLNGPCKICGYTDVDYAGANDNWKSATEYIVLINKFLITCHPII